jgi:transcriptional regulator with XRE-family HTH domain
MDKWADSKAGNRAEVREFLTSRRAKLSPAAAGLPQAGQRRVPGLRRGEVAALAGVSIEYYAKLERGAIAGASASVLEALARALQLDDTERAHLFDLARAAGRAAASALMSALTRPPKRSHLACRQTNKTSAGLCRGLHHRMPGRST